MNSGERLDLAKLAAKSGEKITRQEGEPNNNSGSPITECSAIWDCAVMRKENDFSFLDCPFFRDFVFKITVLESFNNKKLLDFT